jgi:hypothetical protein
MMMEPAGARRMFPSWNEPAFRATYQLTAVQPADMPVGRRTMHGGLVITTFERFRECPPTWWRSMQGICARPEASRMEYT